MSDHFDGKKFFDPKQEQKHGGFLKFLKWQFTRKKAKWPDYVEVHQFDTPPERVLGTELRVSYIGHVTFLIQTSSLNILTDPIWSNRASPLSFVGPKRVIEPGVKFENLPPIDVVLISHNHYDHLDLQTIERLWEEHKPRIIVPLGNDKIIKSQNTNIFCEAYEWAEMVEINDIVKIHLHPMTHWSARGLFDRNKALWAAYNIETPGGNIYFTGDTGYGNGVHFKAAKEKFDSFRLALLPIGAYEPRWFMQSAHMNPTEAVMAANDLGMPYTIPTHYDVFPLADDEYGRALLDLNEAIAANKKAAGKILPLKVGEFVYIPL